ncbi:MAG: Copper resistance protein CopD / Cytochrome c oxidase caa3-type assembly factor CtaG_BS (unrelated to Cox11-CtaG family) [uncultured Friedmanniella sp.]|uniref:Copper resistance protein CopD / Cytochrome c oxidase caa3-type assembly factor CtaG_BS (Unrelated to Cox11-CtaG family) n=1 Tax=uncultured Friedmanniella sp. TaxID=335381 RepID=A0A6J4KDE9_9ACTN|nr:bifunctional copper resistance protein CopD/cytochrome c oxidase assembly protein [uncultured Friedmanniella sp.]CAA9302061.1 MAG: Copper resistance protein CopD / Cytochrome c oxidase caa3-type assembly factor CtaG_BS (unrelated to Cox11-CtaG family) [uncultured Friedmanniella sp.]
MQTQTGPGDRSKAGRAPTGTVGADALHAPGPARTLLAGLVVVVTVGLAVGLLGATGELRADVAEFDPGAVVRYGLPAARAVHDLAAALTVGLLVTAAWFVAPEAGSRADRLSGARRGTAKAAAGVGLTWLVCAVTVIVLTAADVSGLPVGSPGSGAVAFSFLTQVDLGRALLASAVVVTLVVVLVALATSVNTLAWSAGLSLLALLPLALAGHGGGNGNHMNAVDSLALHLLGVCLWVGGLAALVLTGRRLGAQLPTVAGRYSTLALWCFVVVAVSGVVNAALRLGSFDQLGSSYGLLVVGKVAALALLGVVGWWHRRTTLRRLGSDGRGFARLAVGELLVMGATMGLAVALSRSAPPVPETGGDPVAALLGYPVPPPLTSGRYFSEFQPELLWLAVVAAMLGLYAGGVARLLRRGDRWPVSRTVFWVAGCLLLVFVTSGGAGVYGRLHFSTHMLQHMTLMVPVPLLLVFGAPITLALRALTARSDGSFGPREMLLKLVHARFLAILGQPLVATGLFTGSLVAFYYSRLFELAISTHTGHVLMTAHFLLSGYLFVWSLVGIDPGPQRPAYPFRLVLLLMTLGFHAFFGISLMSSETLLAADWWHALGQTDDAALLKDQQDGGAIAWGAGDIPSLLLGVALLVSWVRSDATETRRLDRQADRDEDAELRAYNERLRALTRHEQG